MTEILIQADNLRKYFKSTHAVDGVSLQVAEGEIYGLVGPDGAGKTTLLRLLCGALHADSGGASLAGFDVARQVEQAREHIGYLAQRFALYEELTVLENLRFFAEVRGLPTNQWKPRSQEILDFVGLSDFVERRAGQLSGGMKQKLGLALALINRPRILLLDEPTTGVDPVTRQDFWRLIIGLLQEENLCVLVSTPYMDEAARCKRVIYLANGRIVVEGASDEVARKSGLITYEATGEAVDTIARDLRLLPGVEAAAVFGNVLHVTGSDRALVEGAIHGPEAGALVWHEVAPGLEDVFIHNLAKEDEHP